MNISSKLTDEQIYPEKPSGGYEWWYFDALSADQEWGIVVIFYQGNPFSPRYIKGIHGFNPENYPAISISLYKEEKHEYYGFEEFTEADFNFQGSPFSIVVGENQLQRAQDKVEVTYNLTLDQELDSGHFLKGELTFKSPLISEQLMNQSSEGDRHFWNLIAPIAEVNGNLEVDGKSGHSAIEFKGKGYHDHNTGHEPMKDSFKDWYWGRVHFKDSTLIYYVMNQLDSQQYKAWLIDSTNQEVIDTFDEIQLTAKSRSLLGLKSAKKIILKSSAHEITIQQSVTVDDGPFYQRFYCDAIVNGQGSVEASSGISEYIVPGRIYSEKYWWMVRMRLRYKDEKPHWVQRSKRFYEWTW